MTALLVLLLGVAVAALLTGAMRRYALQRSMLDVPNHRSAHSVPTPRGGGSAIVATVLGGVCALWAAGTIETNVAAALLGGGGGVATVGWIDDHRSLPSWLRAGVHATAAAWAVYWMGGLPHLDLGPVGVRLGWAGALLAIVGIVWLINLYNFMDGIDGLAGGEALVVGAAAGLALWSSGAVALALVALLIAASGAGFLLWNWSPAKIFMGDVGSGFLGFVFGALAVASERAGALPAIVWALLLSAFIVDATITLLRRVGWREPWYEAHSSHAYQRAVRAGYGHARVAGAVLLIDVLLGGLALVVTHAPHVTLPVVALGTSVVVGAYLAVEVINPMRPTERVDARSSGERSPVHPG